MTFRESYSLAKSWQRRVTLISLYHNAKLSRNKEWKLTDSANYFNCSIGLISESLTLSQNWDKIKECKSRNSAMKALKHD